MSRDRIQIQNHELEEVRLSIILAIVQKCNEIITRIERIEKPLKIVPNKDATIIDVNMIWEEYAQNGTISNSSIHYAQRLLIRNCKLLTGKKYANREKNYEKRGIRSIGRENYQRK